MVQPTTSPQVNPSAEVIRVGALELRFLVTSADSNGSVAVFEMTVPATEKLLAPAHSHDAYEETIYGREGILTWTVEGDAIAVGCGEALSIRRGAVHRFDNLGSEDANVLIIISPAVLGPEYFRETADVMAAAAGGPPDRVKLMELMRRHGLTPALPPSA